MVRVEAVSSLTELSEVFSPVPFLFVIPVVLLAMMGFWVAVFLRGRS